MRGGANSLKFEIEADAESAAVAFIHVYTVFHLLFVILVERVEIAQVHAHPVRRPVSETAPETRRGNIDVHVADIIVLDAKASHLHAATQSKALEEIHLDAVEELVRVVHMVFQITAEISLAVVSGSNQRQVVYGFTYNLDKSSIASTHYKQR